MIDTVIYHSLNNYYSLPLQARPEAYTEVVYMYLTMIYCVTTYKNAAMDAYKVYDPFEITPDEQ